MIPSNLRDKRIEIISGQNKYLLNSKDIDNSISPSELMEFSFNEALGFIKLLEVYKNKEVNRDGKES